MRHDHQEKLSGDLTVSGWGTVSVELCRPDAPKTVVVAFAHHRHHHPCNPVMHQDMLNWELQALDDSYLLVISYNVGDTDREIIFSAIY